MKAHTKLYNLIKMPSKSKLKFEKDIEDTNRSNCKENKEEDKPLVKYIKEICIN